jgi:membrane fusion protein
MQGMLFRRQAIEQQKDRLHGQVLVTPSLSFSVITSLLLVWVTGVVIWLASSEYARKETVTGWLEPSAGLIRVFPDAGDGRIKQILVTEGQLVSQGQPLVIVNGDKVLADGQHLETRLLEEYRRQQQMLSRQLERVNGLYQLRQQDANQQLIASQQDLAQLKQQVLTVESRFKLAKARAENYQRMAKAGHIPEVEANNSLEQQLSLQSQLQGLKREQVNQQNRIQQLQTQLALLPNEQQDRQDELNRSLSDIAQRIAQLHGQRAYVLKASVDGRVTNLQAQLGQKVRADKPLLTLVPKNSQMHANLLVPVRAAGFIRPGQPLDIRYDAFPYQKFGLYRGKVASVSDSVLLPNEISQSLVSVQEPVYLVRATLNSPDVQAFGKRLPLKAGMSLSADIRLKDRSLLEWLLEPLYSLKGRL